MLYIDCFIKDLIKIVDKTYVFLGKNYTRVPPIELN